MEGISRILEMKLQASTETRKQKTQFRPARSVDTHYSISRAAEILGVHRNTLRNRISMGEIKAVRKSRTLVRVSATEINKWLKTDFDILPTPGAAAEDEITPEKLSR